MSQTGVLPFVRGIDFTKYNLDDEDNQLRYLAEMQRLRWIRLNNVGISKLPDEIPSLQKLVRYITYKIFYSRLLFIENQSRAQQFIFENFGPLQMFYTFPL